MKTRLSTGKKTFSIDLRNYDGRSGHILETSQERVKLLKAGISARIIEQLYLRINQIKIVNIPLLFEVVDVEQENKGKGFIFVI